MHIFHCWHKIKDSERKIPYKTRCEITDQPQYLHNGGYVLYTIKEKCCICNKEKESTWYRDYDFSRAKEYKVHEDYKSL